MAFYRTKDGDMLDAICRAHYGETARYTEAVLATNPGLAARGPVFSAGVVINLPDLGELSVNAASVRLWD